MDKPAVYLETSVISYLTARPSRDVVSLARQQITQALWQTQSRFLFVASDLVLRESLAGDSRAAAERSQLLRELTLLETNAAVIDLANTLLSRAALPSQAVDDAGHVALAAVHQIRFLATWNCKHIANPVMRHKIEAICQQSGYEPPLICLPDELLEMSDE